jgi:hypothetical protein
MNAIEKFRQIASEATEAFKPESGAPEIIPYGAAIVQLVRSYPEQQKFFEAEFIALTKTAPPELLEFCMHALRWDSLHQYFKQRHNEAVSRNDWRAEPCYRHIVEAFEENWEDATDFYADYFKKAPNI